MEGAPATRGVETLLGEPKRAVLRLAAPMIVAMGVQSLYNLADAFWVAGVGPGALAAVGFYFPFFFLGMALANGIGAGAGTAVSRAIGARDKPKADRVASHALFLVILATGLYLVGMQLSIRPVLAWMGADRDLGSAVDYARIMFAGSPFFFFANVGNNLLRAEGDAARAMRAMICGAVLNIALDPLFIYGFGLGVRGAAWASIASMLVVALVLGRWIFVSRDTWVTFRLRGFRPRGDILREIARVGLPAAVMHGSMFIMALAITKIVEHVGGNDGVAVYTTGWRVVSLAILPMLGVAMATTAVCGAAYGARDPAKLRTTYLYSVRVGVLLELVVAGATLGFAPWIARAFTWSAESARLTVPLTTFLRILWLLYPGIAFGMISSSLFQGMGRGGTALAMTMLRTIAFTVPGVWIAAVALDGGLRGAWWGIVAAHLAYAPVAFGWSLLVLRRFTRAVSQGAAS